MVRKYTGVEVQEEVLEKAAQNAGEEVQGEVLEEVQIFGTVAQLQKKLENLCWRLWDSALEQCGS